MRAAPTDSGWARRVDEDIVRTVAALVRFENCSHTQRHLIFTPKKFGGLGMGSAEARYASAWLGAWEGGLHHVGQALGITTTLELRERWPAFVSAATRRRGSSRRSALFRSNAGQRASGFHSPNARGNSNSKSIRPSNGA